ncbi:MAG: hypothetical protein R3284_05200 [Rubricoccaceae bacterium]|nr:hypothetical protein [Rubricoccaceae bacterium]
MTYRSQQTRFSWLAAIGLAFLASTVFFKRQPKVAGPAAQIPEYLRHGEDDFQSRCYK